MKIIKSTIIKYITLITMCTLLIVNAGCSGTGTTDLETCFEGTVLTVIRDRALKNVEIAGRFRSIGALSDSEYESCVKRIDQTLNHYVNTSLNLEGSDEESEGGDADSQKNMEAIMKNIMPAVSHFKVFNFQSLASAGVTTLHVSSKEYGNFPLTYTGAGYEYTDDLGNIIVACKRGQGKDSKKTNDVTNLAISSFVMGNYVAESQYKNCTNPGEYSVDKGVDPINFFDDLNKKGSLSNRLNEAMHAQVFVLKPNIVEQSGSTSIDGLMALLDTELTDAQSSGDLGALDNYFIPAIDSEGKYVYLLDNDAKGIEDYNMIVTSKEADGTHDGMLGYDLKVAQNFSGNTYGDGQIIEDMIRLRFTEFNESALQKLTELQSEGEYILVKDAHSIWKAFYMVYPIEVISSMEDNHDSTVKVTFKKSGLGLNLKTGKYIKYKGNESGGYKTDSGGVYEVKDSWDYSSYEDIEIDDTDNYYLALTSTQNNNKDGTAPIIMNGYTESYPIVQYLPNEKHKANKPTVTTARLVLSDYLECTFAPDFVTNESLVAFGRKIRFNMSNSGFWEENPGDVVEWYTDIGQREERSNTVMKINKKEDNVAYYVDSQGNKIESLPTLKITDFANVSDLAEPKGNHKMKTIVTNENKEMIIKGDESTKLKGVSERSRETATNIDKEYTTDNVLPTIMFPGRYVAKVDAKEDTPNKQRMYGVVTRFGMFDNALFSDWINSQSQTSSLIYWNQYLSDNSFQYNIDQEQINQYTENRYKFEIETSGIVILDLDTIAKIQKQFDKDAEKDRTKWLRTFFLLLGWVIICYSVVLMLAWIIDANIDIGVKLLDKLTFGNWVAIKYEEDIPYKNVNDQTFLDAKKMFIRTAILIAIGVLLINANIFSIVIRLIDVFGRFGAKVEEVIQGFR